MENHTKLAFVARHSIVLVTILSPLIATNPLRFAQIYFLSHIASQIYLVNFSKWKFKHTIQMDNKEVVKLKVFVLRGMKCSEGQSTNLWYEQFLTETAKVWNSGEELPESLKVQAHPGSKFHLKTWNSVNPYQCGILSSTVHSTVHTKPFPRALQHGKTVSQEEMLDDFFDVWTRDSDQALWKGPFQGFGR